MMALFAEVLCNALLGGGGEGPVIGANALVYRECPCVAFVLEGMGLF